MWVFAYGSLMHDGWEEQFDCSRKVPATLQNYRRTFNKLSTSRWGTKTDPGVTLNLMESQGEHCNGFLFDIPDLKKADAIEYLRRREKDFDLVDLSVTDDKAGSFVKAVVPIYRKPALLTDKSPTERAAMARKATGNSGNGVEYVTKVAALLKEVGIDDKVVTEFLRAVQTTPVPADPGANVSRLT